MKLRKAHRVMGAVLILPFLGWAATGLIFFIKPGYGEAYALLTPKLYSLEGAPPVAVRPEWLEYRVARTVLGDHLLVRTSQGWHHFRPDGTPMPPPDPASVRRLVADAITANPARYGDIQAISDDRVTTTTGVTIQLDWDRLSLTQSGRDTRRINGWYKIHYLQWTGIPSVDRVVGVAGLVLLVAMALTGLALLLGPRSRSAKV